MLGDTFKSEAALRLFLTRYAAMDVSAPDYTSAVSVEARRAAAAADELATALRDVEAPRAAAAAAEWDALMKRLKGGSCALTRPPDER